MAQGNSFDSLNQTYRLLAFCARVEGNIAFYQQLVNQLASFTAWAELPARAEAHGMAPLLGYHLQKSGFPAPRETQRSLKGLSLRHRALNQVHVEVLGEIISLFNQAGIQPWLLKGLALAYQYYPDPALRPATDIDLLVQKGEIRDAQQLLAKAGYRIELPEPGRERFSKEISADAPARNGVAVHVEIHHYDPQGRVYDDHSRDREFEGFEEAPSSLNIAGQTILTPAPMDTLRYLSRHLGQHLMTTTIAKPLQLKWSADMISLVERHADTLDWAHLQKNDPATLERLEVLYSFNSLPENKKKFIPVKKIYPPIGPEQYPTGWPKLAFKDWKKTGFRQLVWQTFKPPTDWWLRLYYGINQQDTPWYGQVIYRLQIFRYMLWAILRKTKLIKPDPGNAYPQSLV